MLEMLPTGPVWPALMWATSRWVDVARETAGGSGVVALVLRKGSEMAKYWNWSYWCVVSFHLVWVYWRKSLISL